MLRQLLQIPYVKDLAKRISRDTYLREACGYKDQTPTEAHFTQMKKRIGVEGFKHSYRQPASTARTYQPGAAGTHMRQVAGMVTLMHVSGDVKAEHSAWATRASSWPT